MSTQSVTLSPLQPPPTESSSSVLSGDWIEFHREDPVGTKLILFPPHSVQVLIEFLDFANVLEEHQFSPSALIRSGGPVQCLPTIGV